MRKKFTPPYRLKAFTFSEVLITLVIIGVIAAITVPNIIQTTEKQEVVSKVKKAYSVLQQATYRIAMEDGVPVGDYSLMRRGEFFDSFSKSVNTIKRCKNGDTSCFGKARVVTLNGNSWEDDYLHNNALVTADGILYSWSSAGGNICSNKGLNSDDIQNCIGRFYVDVNGGTPPNIIGRDVFFFVVVNGKGIVPAGAAKTNDCRKQDSGITCAAKVLRDSAITYY